MTAESQPQDETDIDAQADLVELEMEDELATGKDEGYLLPWLVPLLILAAFILVIALIWLRR